MQITANLVKELRERTGAGMMECKKSLTEAQGDIERAIEILRTSGQAKADNKSGRIAAEGLIIVSISDDHQQASLLEVNSETDFVAKEDNFKAFCQSIAGLILKDQPSDVDALSSLQIDGESIDEARKDMIIKVGENIQIRRFVNVKLNGENHAVYTHNNRIGVLVDMQGGSDSLAKDIAMHIAASKPQYINADEVPASALEKEKEILSKQAEQEGKPANIVEKMVQGRINKYIKEITLLGQPFIKDTDISVGKMLEQNSAKILAFHRYEIGEGIEKKKENFAEEVMAQIR